MKLKLTVTLDVKGVTRNKLLENLWEEFSEEVDGRITDTYFLTDDDRDKEVEVEVNVDNIDYES
jgi:hypothetical protein